ncbi:helix-turn-helix domain-containing protein [Candidatus Woesebacteria bacterium]|nr:helix-turn-helix domain-containing protein [Candidatus Woesebacteria bacterium]
MQLSLLPGVEAQSRGYIQTCKSLQTGFFQNIRAIVLPYITSDGWYLPETSHLLKREFWNTLEKLDDQTIMSRDFPFLKEVSTELPMAASQEQQVMEFEKIKSIWSNYSATLLSFFNPSTSITTVYCVPTTVGTFASFYLNHDTHTLTIWYRIDKGIEHFFHMVIAGVLQACQDFDENNITEWQLRQKMADFIVEHSALHTILPMTTNTLDFLNEGNANLVAQSTEYYQKLGFPVTSLFTVTTQGLTYQDKLLIGLTDSEKAVLELLIKHHGQLVSFDDCAVACWQDSAHSSFSLQAIAKVIQRIREKLRKNGIIFDPIFTVRKNGYILYD